MNSTLVIGHKNPDTDSICSAITYANLKAKIDPHNTYIAGRCGHLNQQTRYVLERFNVDKPLFYRDIHTRIKDILEPNPAQVTPDTPIFEVMRNIDERRIRISPVVSQERRFEGVVSILEVANFFLEKDITHHPRFLMRPENLPAVIPGYFHCRGEQEEFPARIFAAAMPFERALQHFETMDDENMVLILGKRRDFIQYAIGRQFPAIILTGIDGEEELDIDFSGYRGWVFVSQWDTAETLRRCTLAVPCKSIMNRNVPTVSPQTLFEQGRDQLSQTEHKGLPVVKDQQLVGLVTRSHFLRKPRTRLILMDHNEIAQAVDGAEDAEIVEIVDHHRLGALKTTHPIHIYAKPVGSTCTLVYQQYRYHQVGIDATTAGLLLCGILSDTVITKSPTTTAEDVAALEALAVIAGVDYQQLGMDIFKVADSLGSANPEFVVSGDLKEYHEFGVSLAIAQVEVVTLSEPPEVYVALQDALQKMQKRQGLHWAMLLITDIIQEKSVLLTSGYPKAEQLFRYQQNEDGSFVLPGVLSRKKQLLPEVLRVLEECQD
ncbi:putative manganese-dependent inorganic diphosphatase [Desulfurispira natronophila]|uniref:inorganic diphosphatase n=1 Tax=Desulfurispira natronophila TaxID=682562 RepID=A0A7W7Y3U5_9BACT|nr:putative manganese-dependent inorganic diphosphatase [Desulfurispira natronophila]MBB5021583.1 manganese-dependent inorganic pyrophosphatase [Desulfurispira natronophila]